MSSAKDVETRQFEDMQRAINAWGGPGPGADWSLGKNIHRAMNHAGVRLASDGKIIDGLRSKEYSGVGGRVLQAIDIASGTQFPPDELVDSIRHESIHDPRGENIAIEEAIDRHEPRKVGAVLKGIFTLPPQVISKE
jgi:hypothetical protein